MESKYNIVVAHPGKQHSIQTAIALNDGEMLCQYITTVYYKKGSLTGKISSLLKGRNKVKAGKRYDSRLPEDKVTQYYEGLGLLLLAIRRIPIINKIARSFNDLLMDAFAIKVAKYAIKNNADALIMYDSTSIKAFRYLARKAPNIVRVLDVSIAHRAYNKDLYEKDYERYHDRRVISEQKYLWKRGRVNRYIEESDLSDICLAPSNFVVHSLLYAGVKKDKILKVPYGVNLEHFKYTPKCNSKLALKLIFVGALLRRKGIHHLLKVVSQYSQDEVTLNIVGDIQNDNDLIKRYNRYSNISFSGFLSGDDLVSAYHKADVFVLPSLSEGLALVGLEAMSAGLPLICSTNTGIDDLIVNYETGIVIDPLDEYELQYAIDWFIAHKDKIPSMGEKASQSAKGFSWTDYSEKLRKNLTIFLKMKHNELNHSNTAIFNGDNLAK